MLSTSTKIIENYKNIIEMVEELPNYCDFLNSIDNDQFQIVYNEQWKSGDIFYIKEENGGWVYAVSFSTLQNNNVVSNFLVVLKVMVIDYLKKTGEDEEIINSI